MLNRFLLLTAAALSLFVSRVETVSAGNAADSTRRPNFVVILCDDLGYGDLGCFGHPHIRTPNLDRLAAQGIRLTSCYSSAPVCSSSRAGLLTGRTPSRVGVYDWIPEDHLVHLTKNEITIATLLKGNGYDTAHVGKWHCNGRFNSDEQPRLTITGLLTGSRRRTTQRRRTRIRGTSCGIIGRLARRKATRVSSSPMKRSTG